MHDIILMQFLNIRHFRFSISWPRIFPAGIGQVNKAGVDFYNRVIDFCLEMGISPWVTLYHWDLPQRLEEKGGWANRDVTGWFETYSAFCIKKFGDRVKHWLVLNEPAVFTGAGYFLGSHAPGKKGLNNFLPAMHHAVLCQGIGGRMIKERKGLQAGTSFSYTLIDPLVPQPAHEQAALRADVLVNRSFLEPMLGLGYPDKDLRLLQQLERYVKPGDEQLMVCPMDFLGIQHYTRERVRFSALMPYLHARPVPASKRGVATTAMGWEVYPEGMYRSLKRLTQYKGLPPIIITENGAAFTDECLEGKVEDTQRINYLTDYLRQLLRAKEEGVNVNGYFVWSLTDNVEWAEGRNKRFGLIYVDYKTGRRYVKASGHWYRQFLEASQQFAPAAVAV